MGTGKIKVGVCWKMNDFMIVLYFLMLLLNMVCMVCRKKSKIVLILTYALLFFLFVNNMEYGDARTYRKDFEIMERDTWEPGYIFLRMVAKSIGIAKYQSFLVFLFLFSSLCLMTGFRSLRVNMHMVYSLGMFFLCPWLFVIVRFFIGFAVAVFSLKYFYKGKYIQYAIWVVISVFFHKSMAVFILALFTRIPYKRLLAKKDIIWKIFIASIMVVSIFALMYTFVKKQFLFGDIVLNMVAMVSKSIAERLGIYMGRITQWGAIPVLMVYAANCWFAFLMKKELTDEKYVLAWGEIEACRVKKYTEIAWRVSLIFVVFLPLDVLSVNFGRFNIVPTMFNIAAFSQLNNLNKKRYRKMLIGFFGMVGCWIITGWINFDINIFDYINQCGLFSK